MMPKWPKLASLAQEICTLKFQFFGAVFVSKGYPFKNIFVAHFAIDIASFSPWQNAFPISRRK